MAYWVKVLQDGIPTVVEKAAASEGNSPGARAGMSGWSLHPVGNATGPALRALHDELPGLWVFVQVVNRFAGA